MAQVLVRKLLLIYWITLSSADLTALLSSAPKDYTDLILNKTRGSTPEWLKGALYRVGPGLFEHGGRSVNSVTDGLAKVHSWVFDGDEPVKYSAIMVPSYNYNITTKNNIYAPNLVIENVIPDFCMMEEMELMIESIEKKDNAIIAIVL